jgi:preprotein translocase subunit SecF
MKRKEKEMKRKETEAKRKETEKRVETEAKREETEKREETDTKREKKQKDKGKKPMKIELFGVLHPFVEKTNNKKLIAIPLAILAISLLIIAVTTIQTGSPVHLGMDFVGGIQITVTTSMTEEQIKDAFSDFPLNNVRISGTRAILQFSQMEGEQLRALENVVYNNPSFRDIEEKQVAPIYGQQVQRMALLAILISFAGMAIGIFVLFRSVVPSFAIILVVIADLLVPLAVMNILRIELTLGTVAALLMLIAYSVDSDILLTHKLLKRSGSLNDKVAGAMRTGLLMTTTSLAAFFVMFMVSTYLHYIVPGVPPIPLLSQISFILMIGLMADIFNAWFLNVGILREYLTHPKSRKGGRSA